MVFMPDAIGKEGTNGTGDFALAFSRRRLWQEIFTIYTWEETPTDSITAEDAIEEELTSGSSYYE